MKREVLLGLTALSGCADTVTEPMPPKDPVPPGPQMVTVKGRLGTFVYHHNEQRTHIDSERPWNRPCAVGNCNGKLRWVTNVFDGFRRELDSLARLYPNARCVTRTQDAPEVVDCLRVPVHVGDQTVYTDSLGWFTAGPFLEGTPIKVWVDHEKLPIFQKARGARSNCNREGGYYPNNQCRFSTPFNWRFMWKFDNTHADTMVVIAGESNIVDWPRNEAITTPIVYDYFVLPAWHTRTHIIRVPSAEHGDRMRIWGGGSREIIHDKAANWNGEVVFRQDKDAFVWGTIQLRNPWPESDELCSIIRMISPFTSDPSDRGTTHVDYSDGKITPGFAWTNCAGYPPLPEEKP